MDKAIEIKRRAQRSILNGDLDGALAEYEKLIASGDTDPYSWVLLADLLYKKGNAPDAQRRYLEAVDGYEKNGLYKNGIAVCKKMARLSLAPLEVAKRLAALYTLDGLATEAVLAHQQYADLLVKHDRLEEARDALAKAAEINPDSGRSLDRLGEIQVLVGNPSGAAVAWREAAGRYERSGHPGEAKRCLDRIGKLDMNAVAAGTPVDASSAATTHADSPAQPSGADTAEADPARARAAVADNILGTMMATPPGLERPEDQVAGDDADSGDDPVLDRLELESISDSTEPEHEATAETSGLSLVGLDPARHDDAGEGPPVARAGRRLELVSQGREEPREPYDREDTEPDDAEVSEEVEEEEAAPLLEATNGEIVEDDVPSPPRFHLVPKTADAESGEDEAADDFVETGPDPFDRELETAQEPEPEEEPEEEPEAEAEHERVYVIDDTELEPYGDAEPETEPEPEPHAVAQAPVDPSIAIERFGGDDASPTPPGLGFAGAESEAAGEPSEDPGLAAVSMILGEAQAHFHGGDRDAASMALMRAAQAYDRLGRYDSAAAIYRSLGHSPDVSIQLMMLWIKNCQRRDDRAEAARVACELGDRALNDGDVPGAHEWFERARSYDANNELAARRLKQMETPGAHATAAPVAPVSLDAAAVQGEGFVHVRTDHDEPLIVELGQLIEDFRKAIEPELASDPQGNYDLAVSYREMGLIDQAIDSFRRAAADPAFRLRAGELAGRCLLDLGRFDEAADALHAALASPELLPSAAVDLRYQLGLALEAAGRGSEALAEFERVYAAQASYPDVAMKIRLLRKSAGAE